MDRKVFPTFSHVFALLIALTLSVEASAAQQTRRASAEYHFSLGEAYALEGNVDKAIEEYRLTLVFDPKSPVLYARLAGEMVKKGLLAQAMETCKQALKIDPHYTDVKLLLAGLYSVTHEFDGALEQYNQVLKSHPDHLEATLYKAQLLLDSERADEALSVLKSLASRKPSATILYHLGRAEESVGHQDQAVAAYRKALSMQSDLSDAALALARLYESQDDMGSATKVYREIFDETKSLPAAARLSSILLKQKKYDEALPYLEAVGASDPSDVTIQMKLGLIHMEMKRYGQAIALFKALSEKFPDADRVHYYLGHIYEQTKQVDLAIGELSQVPSSSRLYGEACIHAGQLFKQKGSVEEAKALLKSCTDKNPKVVGFYLVKATFEDESSDLKAAISTLERGVQLFPEDEKVRYYLGSLYDRVGRTDKGLQHMEAILRINPDNVDALNFLGYTWSNKRIRLADAELVLKRALSLRPNNPYLLDSWGYYLLVTGKLPESIKQFEKAVEMKPKDPAILEHLGDAYAGSHLPEKAVYFYRLGAKVTSESAGKRRLEEKVKALQN